MKICRVAVPPGVGDIYWCLTKLKALRDKLRADRIELCVQKAGPARSLAWAEMVDFVDTATFHAFAPGIAATTGYHEPGNGIDCVLWPNAVVDRGRPLSDWLPDLALDLDFTVRTEPMGEPRVLVYASSRAINKAWVPNLGPEYWLQLMQALSDRFGQVTLIGAAWDREFTDDLRSSCNGHGMPCVDMTGQTSLPQIADMLKRARLVIGVISGMTILANHFRTPTVAIYPRKQHPDFPRSWVAPDAPYQTVCAPDAPSAGLLAERASTIARR